MIVFRPAAAFVYSHPAPFFAFGFGAGLAPYAPGTFGTAVGWALGWALGGLHPEALLVAALVSFGIGVWAGARPWAIRHDELFHCARREPGGRPAVRPCR